MSAHLDAGLLSAYLDRELARRATGRVESHLASCSDCRERLDGLHRLVEELHRAGPARTLPELVDQRLRHRLAAATGPHSLLERVEGRMRRFAPAQASIPLVFALVMGLVAVVYLFAWGTHRYSERQVDQVRSEQALPRVHLGGREWRREEERWVESTLAADTATREVLSSSAEGAALLEELPGLDRLLETAIGVALESDGEAILLVVRSEARVVR